MRIAIPSDDGTNLAAHTGRAGGFVIYDIEGNQVARLEYRSNRFTAHAKGECPDEKSASGRGNHDHGELLNALHDCQVMIARGMGPRLVMDLFRRNIEVVFCDQNTADEVAAQFASGTLATTGKSACGH